MSLRHSDIERVIAVARDATQGGSFGERMERLYAHVRAVVPFTHSTAGVFDSTTLAIPVGASGRTQLAAAILGPDVTRP